MDQKKLEQFEQENGMTLDEAWNHVKKWNFSGKKEEVKRGCQEILRLFPDHEAKKLFEKINQTENTQNQENQSDQTNLSIENNKATENIQKSNQLKEKVKEATDKITQAGAELTKKINTKVGEIQDKITPQERKQIALEFESQQEENILVAKEQVTTNDERIYAAISYLWILGIFSLIARRESVFVRFHAKQGLVFYLITSFFQSFIGLGFLFASKPLLRLLTGFLLIILMAFFIFQAWNGKWFKIPVIWNIGKKIPV